MQVVSLLLGASSLSVEHVTIAPELITIDAATTLPSANCPCCGGVSFRVHSRYVRKLTDLPAHGTAVKLRVRVRRFFCDNTECQRRIFAERLGTLAEDHARKTQRLAQSLCQIGLALGGAPGSRLSENLAMSCGGSTMLRLVRGIPDEAAVTPRVLGVDDFAFRRAHHYGTILCDLERHRPVDLLPDRTAQSLADWLEQHPGVEIISRDRAGFYAQGARDGAPDAVQVADRFHLVHNIRDALKRMLDRQQQIIREVAKSLASSQPVAMDDPIDTPPIEESTTAAEDAATPKKLTVRQERTQAARARRIACYEKAVELGREGVSQREIGRRLGLNRGTVRQYLQAGQFPERAGRHYISHSDPVADKICKRWAEGCHNAAQIARELIAEKFDGSYYMIRRRVHKMLAQGLISKIGSVAGSGTTATVKPPSPTRLSWLLFADEGEISDEDRTLLQALYEKCAEAKAAGELARAFRRMVRQRQGAHLGEWMSQATTAGAPREIKSFAEFLRQDYDAVKAGLTLPWNNGQLEGQVNRLKLIKRQMFGRASFALLRVRVLRAG